jgi:ATP-dependent protease ClpP protease subunit
MAWAIEVKNETDAEILLYDEIGEYWGKSAKNFVNEIKDLGNITTMVLRINSAGGDVFDAQAMYSYLRTHKAHKTVRIDGLAASAASFVAMAGDKIIMPSNALMMIHNPWSFAWGDSSEMRKEADFLDKIRDTIATVYVARTGLDYEKIKTMMDEETWMTADEALSQGFCDETDEAIEIAACARSLTEGDITWKTGTGEARFSRELGAKMPESAKKVPLIIESAAKIPEKQPQNIVLPKEEPVLDIKNIADLEKEFPQLVKEIRDAADSAAYTRGAENERARLKALDGLTGPGREVIIAKAKYEEPKDARDIAMELLQASANVEAMAARQEDAAAVNAVLGPTVVPETADSVAAKIADEINAMRGYKK